MATPFKGLARFLSPQTPLAMSPAMRSQLVQQLLSQNQSPQGIVSPAGTANKALQGLLLRRAGIQEKKEADQLASQQGNLASTLARGALDRPGEDPRMTDARSRANKFSALLQAGQMPSDPMSQALLGEQAKSLFAQQTRDIREGLPGEFVDVGGDTPRVIREAPEQPQTSDDIKEYNYAVSNDGYEGTFEQWVKGQREAGAQRTTVSVNGDSIPAGLQAAAVKSSDQADLLRSQVTEIQTFRDLAANTETGGLAPITLPFKQVLLDFGISVGEGVPLQEAFKAQENQMALRLRNPDSGFGLTGNTSNRDIEFLTGAVASLGKTPEGNQAILTIMLAKQRRGAELSDLKSEYIWSTGSLKGWPDARKQFVEQNPFLLPEEQESLMQLKSSGLARLLTTDPASLTPEQLRELAGVQ